jgi:hypothetical protein
MIQSMASASAGSPDIIARAMANFRGAVVDSERSDVAVDALDHRVGGDAKSAKNL